MSKIISLHQTKGGVGKTTTIHNLAFTLSRIKNKEKILLIDCDPQPSLTSLFDNASEVTLFDLLYKKERIEPTKINNNLFFISSDRKLHTTIFEVNLLDDLLTKFYDDFDYILLDTSPALGNITQLALYASNYTFIPAECSFLGIAQIQDTVDALRELAPLSNKSKLGGIFLTKHIKNQLVTREITENYKNHVLKSHISKSAEIEKAHLKKLSSVEINKKSETTKQFTNLAKEILTII